MPKLKWISPIRIQTSKVRKTIATFALLLLMGVLQTTLASAQGSAAALEFLNVEFWPDFDQPAVLVLLTGELPAEESLPTSITLPIPEEATINAIARIDSEGNMFTDLASDDSVPGQLTLTVTEPTFRIEYYLPYESAGDLREFAFQWLADLDVNQLLTTFQQPSLATDVALSPEPTRTQNGQFDLLYHEIASQAVPAGIPFNFEASYRMIRPELSAEALAVQPPPATAPSLGVPEQNASSESDFNWLIVLAAVVAVLAFAVVAWLIYSNQKRNRRVRKPRPTARSQKRRSSAPTSGGSKSKFCHECGQPLDPADKFCRNCGTVVKT